MAVNLRASGGEAVNLVVVSNRVARGKASEPMTGGLAAALLPVVEKSGAIWVGSSGRVRDGTQKEPFAEIEALGAGALAMLDLPAAHYGGYYEGFANSALWPALHSRADLIRASQEDYLSYREVNAFMARALLRFKKPDTMFWIQDYHFLALGAELRALGVTQPLGFFLHTPWPARAIVEGVPHHRELVEAMLAYDLIGFQTEDDCESFVGYLSADLGLEVENGVEAFDRMWTSQPALQRTVSLLQIATPSRGAIEAYGNLQNELAKLVSDVNGRHGEVDWTPIRYLNKGFGQYVLAGLYRTAQVGVVTPLHDGMNLVAKEYVAAQNPADPGVLVLSKFAGAANQLNTALLVNPHDIDSMARTIATAVSMPLTERRMRWEAMMEKLNAGTIQQWFADFVDALRECQADKAGTQPLMAEPPTLWPLRSVNAGARSH